MKNRVWVIIFSLAALICLVFLLAFYGIKSPVQIAGIYQNGELVEKIDLNSVTAEREITLSGDYGENIILISHGNIEMKSADCPDKICVKHGKLTSAGSPIVCLPNRIVIKFEGNSDTIDVKTGAVG